MVAPPCYLHPAGIKDTSFREYWAEFSFDNDAASYIDVSYPALKGASGAPVVNELSGHVLGMIVGNVENQLAPDEIERTQRSDGTKDQIIRYFLPSAHAIRASHLRDVLTEYTNSK
jgi:hypothetical protein